MNAASKPTDTLNTNLASTPAVSEVPLISSSDLFQQHNTLRIEHRGQCYMLRITRENKLILTK